MISLKYILLYIVINFGTIYSLTFKKEYPGYEICRSNVLNSDATHAPKVIKNELKRIKDNKCTHIIHKVRIMFVTGLDEIDLSTIEYIAGDLTIQLTSVKNINLSNLKVVRGHTYHEQNLAGQSSKFAVMISHNSLLVSLDMRNLRVVSDHDVFISFNPRLLYGTHTINWNAILYDAQKQKTSFIGEIKKGKCSNDCKPDRFNKTYCWGPQPDMCQKYNYKCRPGFGCKYCIFNKDNVEAGCCSDQCVGGCTGYTNSDCLVCKMRQNGKKCVDSCPSQFKSDWENKPNPDFKYTTSMFCTKNCPKRMYPENVRCVYKCSKDYELDENKRCVHCSKNCKKRCNLKQIAKKVSPRSNLSYLDKKTLESLSNCTTLDGYVRLNGSRLPNVTQGDMKRYFGKLKIINGGLSIRNFTNYTSLSFFSKLEKVVRYELTGYGLALNKIQIAGNNIQYLGWKNFQESTVSLDIRDNPSLCYLDVDWKNIVTISERNIYVNQSNVCEGKKCHEACDETTGCWGPGNDLCRSCALFSAGDICTLNCTLVPKYFHDSSDISKNTTCKKCHPQCAKSCNGPTNRDCIGKCANKKQGNMCVEKCDKNFYVLPNSSECQNCSVLCKGNNYTASTCTGPSTKPIKGGCNSCTMAEIDSNNQVVSCVPVCRNGTYHTVNPNKFKDVYNKNIGTLCRPCNKLCGQCKDESTKTGHCRDCKGVWFKDECREECPSDESYNKTLSSDGTKLECLICHPECILGCTGPGSKDCKACKNSKIYLDKEKNKFYCNSSCPSNKPFKRMEPKMNQVICLTEWEQQAEQNEMRGFRITIITVVALFVIIIIVIVVTVIFLRRKARKERLRSMLTARFSNINAPSCKQDEAFNQPPNMGRLAIINIDDLIFEDQTRPLGFGAFGYVYKGKWKVPKEEDPLVRKSGDFYLQVAIKVLRNLGVDESNAIMEEAKIMASVDHQNCLRFIGVCLSYEKPCIVTAFVKDGSLDKYLQRNKDKISSLIMLSWAEQIANGMWYLTKRGIIHRDLATRNVLVNTIECVQITDFGLSKMLENVKDKEIVIKSGRVPIRWLAIETLTEGKYSHETDVWAYGVTLWEIFTFGKVPYEDQDTSDIPDFVIKGGRLPQPDICSLDVYIELINSWMENPALRPTFETLMNKFTNFAKNPGRYISIEGDPYEIQSPNASNSMEMRSTAYFNSYLDNKHPTTDETTLYLLDSDERTMLQNGNHQNDQYNFETTFSHPNNNNNNPSTYAPENLPTRTSKSHFLSKPFRKFYESKSNNIDEQSNSDYNYKDETDNAYVTDPIEQETVRLRNPNNQTTNTKPGPFKRTPGLMSETPRFHSNVSNNQPLKSPPRNTVPTHNTLNSTDEYLEPMIGTDSSKTSNFDTDGYLEPGFKDDSLYIEPSIINEPSRNSAGSSQPVTNTNRSTISSNTNQYANQLPLRLSSKEIPNMDEEERSPLNNNSLYFPQSFDNTKSEYLEASPKTKLVKMEHDSFS